MKPTLVILGLALSLTCTACNDGGGDGKTNFTGFVNRLAANPSDTTDPVKIDDTTFKFSEDPHAFDALFQ